MKAKTGAVEASMAAETRAGKKGNRGLSAVNTANAARTREAAKIATDDNKTAR